MRIWPTGRFDEVRVSAADGHAEREAAKVMVPDAKSAAGDQAQLTSAADQG